MSLMLCFLFSSHGIEDNFATQIETLRFLETKLQYPENVEANITLIEPQKSLQVSGLYQVQHVPDLDSKAQACCITQALRGKYYPRCRP